MQLGPAPRLVAVPSVFAAQLVHLSLAPVRVGLAWCGADLERLGELAAAHREAVTCPLCLLDPQHLATLNPHGPIALGACGADLERLVQLATGDLDDVTCSDCLAVVEDLRDRANP